MSIGTVHPFKLVRPEDRKSTIDFSCSLMEANRMARSLRRRGQLCVIEPVTVFSPVNTTSIPRY